MKNKNWIVGLIFLIIIIVGLSFFGFWKKEDKTTQPANSENSSQVAGQNISLPEYFSQDAKVMYFFQDTCIHCINQEKVLERLGKEGYQVKPMNIGANHPENEGFWLQYNVSGTPTFIAQNGDRLVGEQDYDSLKAWLDQHK